MDKLDRFKSFLVTRKGLSVKSADVEKRIISKVLKDIDKEDPNINDFDDHIFQMYEKKISNSHIRNTIISIESYCEFINTPIKFGRPKKPKPILKDILSEADLTLLIHACKNIRERAITTLLAYSGIRNNELCSLRVSDIDFSNNQIRIISGKNSIGRIVCISPECTKVLMDYIKDYPRDKFQYLFTTKRENKQYNTWNVEKLIRKVGSRILPNRRIYPHLFRHSLASCLLNRGANIMTIKEQLGHSHIDTTMIYLRSSFSRIEAEYRLYSPKLI